MASSFGPTKKPLPVPVVRATEREQQPGDTTGAAAGGVVLDAQGAPVQDATVSCNEPERDVTPVVTGSDGRFHLPSEAIGCHGVARHPKLGRSAEVVITGSDTNTLMIRAAGGIDGVVVSDDGTPISSFWMSVDSYAPEDGKVLQSGDWQRMFSNTEPPGSLSWPGLPPGRYVFVATVDGLGSTTSAPIEVRANAVTGDVRMVVAKGQPLHGKVVNGVTHAPITGAMIAFWREKALGLAFQRGASTGDNGSFELGASPRAPFSIRIVADGYESKVFNDVVSDGSEHTPVVFAIAPEAPK